MRSKKPDPLRIPSTKTCLGCKREKPSTAYYTHKSGYLSARCRPCHAEQKRELLSDPEKRRLRNETARLERVKHYGITIEEYDQLFNIQGGACAGCKRKPTGRRLDIDHKHQKQEKKRTPVERRYMVRGLLCHRCNRALGLLGDSKDTVYNLALYISSPPAMIITGSCVI